MLRNIHDTDCHSFQYNIQGYWDYGYICDDPWADPPKYCTDYPGQRGGRYVNDEPVKNRNNRTDVEGEPYGTMSLIERNRIFS